MTDPITTPDELDALPESDVLILASGRYPRGGGTFHDCWARPVPPWITGTDERAWEVLVYGETWPDNVVATADITLPATVLYRPDTT